MQSLHNRKFVPSGVALVKGRLKNTEATNRQDIIEKIVIQSKILENAPFLWIGLNYCYGEKNDLIVEFSRINKKYGDLTISLEIDMKILQWADQHNLDLLQDIFIIAAIEALIQVGKKYKLPTAFFEQERSKYGNIPNTIQECETYSRQDVNTISQISCNDEDQTENDDDQEHQILIIEYAIDCMGTDDDLQKRYQIQDFIDDLLQSAHLGYCDGGSIGSGTMEICCVVTNYEKARDAIEIALKDSHFGNYSKIYEEE